MLLSPKRIETIKEQIHSHLLEIGTNEETLLDLEEVSNFTIQKSDTCNTLYCVFGLSNEYLFIEEIKEVKKEHKELFPLRTFDLDYNPIDGSLDLFIIKKDVLSLIKD